MIRKRALYKATRLIVFSNKVIQVMLFKDTDNGRRVAIASVPLTVGYFDSAIAQHIKDNYKEYEGWKMMNRYLPELKDRVLPLYDWKEGDPLPELLDKKKH